MARDSRYLTWRYLDHPRFQYRLITIPEGKRTGLLVWRLETIRRSTPNGLEDVDRMGRIVELLPASPENAQCLLQSCVQAMRAEGAFGADFYGFHAATNRYLDEAGFVETTKPARRRARTFPVPAARWQRRRHSERHVPHRWRPFVRRKFLPMVLDEIRLRPGPTELNAAYRHVSLCPGSSADGLSQHQRDAARRFSADRSTIWQNISRCLRWKRASAICGATYKPRRDLCLLTFDDGLKEHYREVTPILHERGIEGVFHVITACSDEKSSGAGAHESFPDGRSGF